MSVLAALLPPVVVCVAFVAILLGVKRYTDRESRESREDREDRESREDREDRENRPE